MEEIKLLQTQIYEMRLEINALKNKVEHWGDPHEYLNGKHIKDWEGKILDSLEVFSEEDFKILQESFVIIIGAIQNEARRRGSISNGNGN